MSKVTIGLKNASDLILAVGKTEVVINGFARNTFADEHAHGITENVDESFWDQWLQENKEHSLVKGGFIFALGNKKEVEAKAKSRKTNKGGTEALEQDEGGVEKREN